MSKYGSGSGNGNERKRNYTLLRDKIYREIKRFIIVQETEEKNPKEIFMKRNYYLKDFIIDNILLMYFEF